ncbi:hypothetical protein [Pluralibacter gergoviae]|uniref:Uncharacterized protein n=1 Tax=Pluralibacter gergoviae TaxID=61647 RepID=A0AAW8HJF1_PLUGE|nr:hypothetical protein [Pluralibacter gergoviae]MDQ2308765.1 hypothetical protein [Pluralibacter gergoviae]
MSVFSLIIGHSSGFLTSKKQQIEQDRSKANEKRANGKKIAKKGCAKKWDPYNAPPSTRSNGKQAAGLKEKALKNGVDSERGKRNIRHLATER